jgi:hypothetical protein
MPLLDHTHLSPPQYVYDSPGQSALYHIRRLGASSLTGRLADFRVFKSVGTFKSVIFQIGTLVFFYATDFFISISCSVKE